MRVIVSVVFSYAVACLIGSAIAGALIFLPGARPSDYADMSMGTIMLSGLRMWGTLSALTAIAAVLPFALAIGLLKWQRITSLFAYTLAGLVVSIAGMFVLEGRLVSFETIISNWPLIVAGAAAGFTYRLCEKWVTAALAQPVSP